MTDTMVDVPRRAGSWRFRIGMVLFALGLICPVFVPVVAATPLPTTWKAALSGLFMLGLPEVLWFLAVLFMGKEGFNFLKGRLFGFLKRTVLPSTVGRTRYGIGLVLFTGVLLCGWVQPYLGGLIPHFDEIRFEFALVGDGILLLSLLLLGGEFWAKIRAVYVYDATVRFPESSSPECASCPG